MNCNMKLKWKFSFECVATTVSCFSVQEPKIVTSSIGHQGGTSARLLSLCTGWRHVGTLVPLSGPRALYPHRSPRTLSVRALLFSICFSPGVPRLLPVWILIYSLRLYSSVSVKLPDCSDHSELPLPSSSYFTYEETNMRVNWEQRPGRLCPVPHSSAGQVWPRRDGSAWLSCHSIVTGLMHSAAHGLLE